MSDRPEAPTEGQPPDWTPVTQLRTRAFVVGVAAFAVACVGGFFAPGPFFQAYLFSLLFWLGIALGGLGIVMLHHLTGGGWGFVIRRVLEAAFSTLPLLTLLFLPLLLGLHYLYPWADAAAVAADRALRHRAALFTVPWFIGRAVLYFAVWNILAACFRRWSLAQDRTGDAALTECFQRLGGPGLVLYTVTMSLAAIDWMMSIEPDWYSTAFGLIIIAGQGMTGIAFGICVARWLAGRKLLAEEPMQGWLQDLGGMLLAFVLLWLYVAYSQYLIIWAGNLPSEITYYLHRQAGGWKWIAIIMIVLHFALPFVLLLFGNLKRNARTLSAVAGLVLAAHLLNTFWQIVPTFRSGGFALTWFDVVLPVGIGGLWLGVFAGALKGHALVPLHDPRLRGEPELPRVETALEQGR